MSRRVAVLNNRHESSFRTMAYMLDNIGFDVYDAGQSFRGLLNPMGAHYPNQHVRGVVECADLPADALFVTTRWQNGVQLRRAGWEGPVLLYWLTCEGPEAVDRQLVPLRRTCAIAFRTPLVMVLEKKMPVATFWPPYQPAVRMAPRGDFGRHHVFICKDAGTILPSGLLEALRDDVDINLEVYGGGIPDWSRVVPASELQERLRTAVAMCHIKHTDNAGNALMEAALLGVPVIVRRDYISSASAENLLEPGHTCLVPDPLTHAGIRKACTALKDRSFNQRLGDALRRRFLALSVWERNRYHLINLLARII